MCLSPTVCGLPITGNKCFKYRLVLPLHYLRQSAVTRGVGAGGTDEDPDTAVEALRQVTKKWDCR
jgi:hypothetical protein